MEMCSANGRAEWIETSDGQGTRLEREDLAYGQTGRTRRRGGKEEDQNHDMVCVTGVRNRPRKDRRLAGSVHRAQGMQSYFR